MIVAGIVAPIFVLIALGAAARHWRMIEAAGLKGLTDLTFMLAIPALLFGSIVEAAELRVLDAAVLFFAACFIVFAIGVLVGRRVLGFGLAQAGVLGLNACYGNTVMLGVPLISAAFGPEGLAVLLPVIALHSVLLLPVATMVIEAEGRGTRNPLRMVAATLPSLVRNPIIMSLLLALAWRAVGIPVPAPLHRLLAMVGGAGPTLALFCLGASLPDFAAQGSIREAGVALVLKLALMPALVWGFAHLAGLGPLPTAVAVLVAGTPTGANAFFLARRTQIAAASSAGTVVASTALSVVTLAALLAALHP